nr:ASN_HP1_G0028510.mRNA.1.CDS.1 [Saccharomyces cerevisiae]
MVSLFEELMDCLYGDVLEDLKEKYNAILGDSPEEGDMVADEEEGPCIRQGRPTGYSAMTPLMT